jgi:hypothetical protein
MIDSYLCLVWKWAAATLTMLTCRACVAGSRQWKTTQTGLSSTGEPLRHTRNNNTTINDMFLIFNTSIIFLKLGVLPRLAPDLTLL